MKYLFFLPITLLSFGVAFGDYQPGGRGLPLGTDGGGGSDTDMPLFGGTDGSSDGDVGYCLASSCNLH